MTGETHNLTYGIPYPDRFGPDDDEPLLDLTLTRAGLRVLDALAAGELDGEADAESTDVLACTHPDEARVRVHDDLPADDPDQLLFCAVCGDERGWAA